MKLLIQLAQMLFDLQNYYDAIAILSGLDSNSIWRINQHFERLDQGSKETLNDLRDFFDIMHSYQPLREKMETAIRTETPVLPDFGRLLSNLFQYYDATVTFVGGLINVRKCKGVYKMITRIEECGRGRFAFLPIEQVQTKIDQLEDLDEERLIAMSYEIEREDGTLLDEEDQF
jgi:hypothetical protein